MTLIRDTIVNFIGGVSQQPDKLMYPNQAKTLINYLPSPSIGLKDRPPSEVVAKLCNSLTIHPYVHTIIKEDEEYVVLLTGSDIKVFDLEGNEKTVYYGKFIYEVEHGDVTCYTDVEGDEDDAVEAGTTLYTDYKLTTEYTLESGEAVTDFIYNGVNQPAAQTTALKQYITSNSPLKELSATTIADYTFILNKTKTVTLKDDLYKNPYPSAALIFVRQGNYTTDHSIKVNGTTVASYTTTSDLATTKTTNIISNLYNGLVSNLGTTDWNITVDGSVILLEKKDGSNFSIEATDSNSNNDLYAFHTKADAVNLLPTVAPDGFILKITGEDVNKADDYYVQFDATDTTGIGQGSWKECPSPDIKYSLNADTMPHALVREADGSFCFKTLEWTDRGAGDEESAPSPSFIDNTIQEVFTHKGRLAFLSVDKSIYSDTQDIFSFFKKTTTAELDTDPIDVGSNSKMTLLRHSLPFNEELLLFSETATFSIKGGDVFSNSTVSCDLTMEYNCSRYCKPINAGSTGFFVFENGDYSRVMELYITSTYTIDARDITEQVSAYLPSNIYKIAGSTANNVACFLSTDETNAIYVYNYYYSSEQKAQSAWSKWVFENTKILNADWHNNWLYLTTQYSDGIYLERLNFTPKNKEADLDYLVYLDRKVYLDDTDLTYDATTDKTSFTLPYTPVNTLQVVDSDGFPVEYTKSGSTCTVSGEYDELIIGNTFTSIWELGNIYQRQQTQNGTKVIEGTLMLKDINLSYADTGYFKVKVSPKYSTNITSEFEFTGHIAGMSSSTLGELNVSDGTFLVPIIANNEEIKIQVTNDNYLPSCFLSLDWLGDLTVRGQ